MTAPAAPTGRPPARSRRLAVAKLLATVFFLFLVFRKVELAQVLPLMADSRWGWLGACIAVQFLVAFMHAVRWKMLWPRADLPLTKYLYFIFLGQFFSLFVPSTALSEAMRVLAFGKKYGQTQETIGVNLMARVLGMVSQVLVAAVLALWHFREWSGLRLPGELRWNATALAFLVASVAVAGTAALALRRRWSAWRFAQAFAGIWKDKPLFTRALALSLLLQLVSVVGTWTLFRSQTDAAQFWHMAVFGVLTQILLLLPLSLGGVGLREYLNLLLYGEIAGIPADTVLAVSLLGYIPLVVSALVGGAWMAFRNGQALKKEGNRNGG